MSMSLVPGMEKINFSGGEPFIHQRGDYLGKLVKFCKEDLALPSVSIVSNGSLIREQWFQSYGTRMAAASSHRARPATSVVAVFPSTLDLGPGVRGTGREEAQTPRLFSSLFKLSLGSMAFQLGRSLGKQAWPDR